MSEHPRARALYNDNDQFVASWLRGLVRDGKIADGDVHDCGIEELDRSAVAGPGQRHFFAGIGGWSVALRLAGVRDDASVWTGSCPCQPFSSAGRRGGEADPRHLWPAWFRLIQEHRPAVLLGEQVASRDGRAWLGAVRSDLEGAGYVVGAADLPAAGAGAPHRRQRIFFVAHRDEREHASHELGDAGGARGRRDPGALPGAEARGARGRIGAGHLADVAVPAGATRGFWHSADWILCRDPAGGPPVARPVEPGTFPLVAGLPGRMGLLRGYGNSIVPQVAAAFVRAALWAIATTGEVS